MDTSLAVIIFSTLQWKECLVPNVPAEGLGLMLIGQALVTDRSLFEPAHEIDWPGRGTVCHCLGTVGAEAWNLSFLGCRDLRTGARGSC